MKCVFTPPSKFAVSLLVEDHCVFMILTVRKTTWTTLQGLRPSGFPFTRGRSPWSPPLTAARPSSVVHCGSGSVAEVRRAPSVHPRFLLMGRDRLFAGGTNNSNEKRRRQTTSRGVSWRRCILAHDAVGFQGGSGERVGV